MIRSATLHSKDRYPFDRKLIYLYFFFLIFEGAFRKWIMPGASSLFVVIRDPIVFLLVVRGMRRGWLSNGYCIASILLSIISFLLSFTLDRTNIIIQYYGTRIFLFYFPAIFVMSRILTLEDVYKIGKYFVILCIPMTILVVIQYFSPQSAWVNRGVGGDIEGSGFGAVMDYYRASGVFSFAQGLGTFQSIVFAYILIFFYNEEARIKVELSRKTLYLSFVCYLISIPASISRTVLFQTLATLSFLVIGLLITGSRKLKKTMLLIMLLICIIPLLSLIPQVQLFMDVYEYRFEQASEAEGDVVAGTLGERYFGSFIRAWTLNVPLLGHGIGLGTRLALTSFPNIQFITDEEWTRIIYESGYFLGTGFILLRVILSISLFFKSIIKTFKTKDMAPILFLPCVLFLLPQGSLGNAVPLGFTVFITSILMSLIIRK